MDTPVIVIGFNRPEVLEQLFQVLRLVGPRKMFVVADGPRADVPEDQENCQKVRDIFRSIDWTSDVTEIFSETNMGCDHRIASGITEVMRHVDRAIILEDDCIPHLSFFRFCEEMLTRYQDDERVMHVSGSNFQYGAPTSAYSYYFSRYTLCWGWATWKRSWDNFRFDMPSWDALKNDGWLNHLLEDPDDVHFWTGVFDKMFAGIDAWDHQWTYLTWLHSGYSIVPSYNLVSNIGFGDDATHTNKVTALANLPTHPMRFPLEHPPHMLRNFCADARYARLLHKPSRQYVW